MRTTPLMKNPPKPPKVKTLNVKETNANEVVKHWGNIIPSNWYGKQLFIRCNSKGEINWEVSPVYSVEELIQRNNVKIL